MSVVPAPPAPYTDFANQYQNGRPGVLPTGNIAVPQSNVTPPNAGFSIPNQMQSGLNANDYTFQIRILDVNEDRNASAKPNSGALSKQPFSTIQPYSLICIAPTSENLYWSMSRGVNEADRPLRGCVLEYLLDSPHSKEMNYTAFERAVNPNVDDANVPMRVDVTLPDTMDIRNMVNTGLFLPIGTLNELKTSLSEMNKAAYQKFLDTRSTIGALLESTDFFDKFQVDGSSLWTTLSDERNKEIDEASGFATFSTSIEGHAFVSAFTSKLKCHVMDTVYVVIRAIVNPNASISNGVVMTHPEMCILTSRDMQNAYKSSGSMDDMSGLGSELRKRMQSVDRFGPEKGSYVILGGWKVGKVVDTNGVPATGRITTMWGKGVSYYQIMLNIERCTAFELVRHLM